uniref:SOGA 1/2-like coiled-coil domain-containing protein n=1 Tax=Myripristis murdjan TaxID=586833 RepID=A0A668AVR4_9TELE
MDLRCRLEHNERDWLREKAELLERFDTERREWENQLRDMQRKIEEVRERECALKEIARVSEELCSYQDEIRRKTGDKRYINPHCYVIFLASTCHYENPYLTVLVMSYTDAPPVPPRISSWSLSSPTPPELELHIPESSLISGGKCHSPCALMDRKCSSPSIVRKFEAMLQKNEGKILTDGVIASCSVPANSNCNVGCCHSRWSCDVSKFSSNKLAPYLPVQKSFSEVNILTAGKELSPNYRPGVGNLKSPEGHEMPPVVRELPVDLLLPSLEIPSACPSLQGSRRNIVLEKKTAEFNRTLFQAEMGRGVEEQDNFTTVSPVFCKPVCPTTSVSDEVTPPREANFDVRPHPSRKTHHRAATEPGPRVMNDHPWKPLTLAAYPRPEGSRSNYGAVERILKSYESAAWAQENQNQQNEMPSSPSRSPKQEERVIELKESSNTISTKKKNFSRPARPANRRLPSRWASRSPSSSSSTSSSPSTTPVVPPSISYQKHTSSFTYSHAFHMETVII